MCFGRVHACMEYELSAANDAACAVFAYRGVAACGTHLRYDLAEYGDDHRRQGETHQARRELRHHDRQQGVDGYVAKQQRAQEEIAVCPHRLDFLRKKRTIILYNTEFVQTCN